MAAQDKDLILIPSESEYSEADAPPQPAYKRRAIGLLVGVAMLGAAVCYFADKPSASLRNGNIGQTVELDWDSREARDARRGGTVHSNGRPGSSTFYIIKHEFIEKSFSKAWWEKSLKLIKDEEKWAAWTDGVQHAGFKNHFFLPTQATGPMYCLWEAASGKGLGDMKEFINNNKLSPVPGTHFKNEVMQIDLELTFGRPPVKPAFEESREGDDRRLESVGSTFFLVEHTFTEDKYVRTWWNLMQGVMKQPKKFGAMMAAIDKTGFHNTMFMPTARAGPMFCLWEAKGDKTEEDMAEFINHNKLSPAGEKSGIHNEVMKIMDMGKPPVKPFF